MEPFNYLIDYRKLNLRKDPEHYRVGKGEQGVLLVEPYKSEILPYWRFKTPEDARKSAETIYKMFLQYEKDQDFVGMDMARKFLQMGFTRARRYANHASGKKYDGPAPELFKGVSGSHGRSILLRVEDAAKAKSAEIFFKAWKKAEKNKTYTTIKLVWKIWFG